MKHRIAEVAVFGESKERTVGVVVLEVFRVPTLVGLFR
jgi:hypothetical protein